MPFFISNVWLFRYNKLNSFQQKTITMINLEKLHDNLTLYCFDDFQIISKSNTDELIDIEIMFSGMISSGTMRTLIELQNQNRNLMVYVRPADGSDKLQVKIASK